MEAMVEKMYLTKSQIPKSFLAHIIVDTIVIVFYQTACNTELAFNLATIKCFDFFCIRILVFLIAIIHCSTSEY